MMEFRRKPFLRAKSENSAEILNRQKLPYIWSSQVCNELSVALSVTNQPNKAFPALISDRLGGLLSSPKS